MPVDDGENVGNLRQVMRDILEDDQSPIVHVDMFPPLKECLALLSCHQVDMGGKRFRRRAR